MVRYSYFTCNCRYVYISYQNKIQSNDNISKIHKWIYNLKYQKQNMSHSIVNLLKVTDGITNTYLIR